MKKSGSNDMLSLKGKVALVTGAASGIGRGTAELLADMGASVAVIDINNNLGLEVEQEIRAAGGEAKYFSCNVISEPDCRNTAEAVKSQFGSIDILFNNAGVIRRKKVTELAEKEWDLVVDVSLKAIFLMSKHVIPVMAEGGGGSIINTGSGWGLKGGGNAVAYCAAKGGVVNMTRAMAIDHGPQGIRVNCVCPGDIDTPLLHDEARQLGEDDEAFMKDAADRPLNRVGVPRDIANTVLYLASDLSAWVTGTSILVDGGGLA
jgi:NAD(P)-dependent dehydrogenase (short-subunit alcohol dehydrogenase family)